MTAGSGIIHQEMPKGDQRAHGGIPALGNLPPLTKCWIPASVIN